MRPKVHMGKWLNTESRYITYCQKTSMENFLIVRTMKNLNQVNCKRCLKRILELEEIKKQNYINNKKLH